MAKLEHFLKNSGFTALPSMKSEKKGSGEQRKIYSEEASDRQFLSGALLESICVRVASKQGQLHKLTGSREVSQRR
jgi:hypothetical protein